MTGGMIEKCSDHKAEPRVRVSDASPRFDRELNRVIINGRARERDDGNNLVVHESDLAGVTVRSLRGALRAASLEWGDMEWVSIADTDAIDFDEEYVSRRGYKFRITDSDPNVCVLTFFNSRYEDELSIEEIEQLLGPTLTKHRLRLVRMEPHNGYMSGPPWMWLGWFEFNTLRRAMPALISAMEEVAAVLDAVATSRWDRGSLRSVLLGGTASVLVGQMETSWLEVKTRHYDLSSLRGKVDLASAVARFANAPDGGLVVIGAKTKRGAVGERIAAITPMPIEESIVRRYRHVLQEHLYPPPDGMRIDAIPVGSGQIVLLDVPPQPEAMRPFLVHGAIVDGKGEGRFISIVRRREDESIATTAAMIHSTIVLGRAVLESRTARGEARSSKQTW